MEETLVGPRSHADMTPEQIRDFHFDKLGAAVYDDVGVAKIIKGLSSNSRVDYEDALHELDIRVNALGRRTLKRTLNFFTSQEVEFDEATTTIEQGVGALSLQEEIDLILSQEPQVA